MPHRRWEKVQSGEPRTSHPAAAQRTEDCTQQLMEAMSEVGGHATSVLQPSTSSEEREEGDATKRPAPHLDVQSHAVEGGSGIHWAKTISHKRFCTEKTAPACRKDDAAGTKSSRAVNDKTCDTPLVSGGDYRSTAAAAAAAAAAGGGGGGRGATDTGAGQQIRASRTEAELLHQHGQLSQLNNLYLPRIRSCSRSRSRSSSTSTAKEKKHMVETTSKVVEAEADRLRRRGEELSQISPRSLALYTRLAECGVDAVDRPFVTCVVKRARAIVWALASTFS